MCLFFLHYLFSLTICFLINWTNSWKVPSTCSLIKPRPFFLNVSTQGQNSAACQLSLFYAFVPFDFYTICKIDLLEERCATYTCCRQPGLSSLTCMCVCVGAHVCVCVWARMCGEGWIKAEREVCLVLNLPLKDICQCGSLLFVMLETRSAQIQSCHFYHVTFGRSTVTQIVSLHPAQGLCLQVRLLAIRDLCRNVLL